MIDSDRKSTTANRSDLAPPEPPDAINQRFPWRAFWIGLLLIPICVWWIELDEIVVQAADLVAMSLAISVIALLLLLIVINRMVGHFKPLWMLSQAELMLIYAMNATTVGICGIGLMQFLVTELPAPQYYKTATNHWDQWSFHLRPWAFPAKSAVQDFYTGRSTLFTAAHLSAWMTPVIVWSVFIFALMGTMYCLATLLQRQWVSNERLLFPLITIPLEITQNGGNSPIFRAPTFWLGAGIAVCLEVFASLHYSVSPGIPYIPIKAGEQIYDIGSLMSSTPWNGIGIFRLSIYPLVIGITYLLSLDVSFSVWFFYLLQKIENILAVSFGFRDPGAPSSISRIPYPDQQCAGAFTGLAVVSVYYAWPHLKRAFHHAFRAENSSEDSASSDDNEPMSYKAAFLGALVGIVFLVTFAILLGISLTVALLFMGLYLLWAITMTRIRAEAGLPWGNGPTQWVHGTIVDTASSANFTTEQLTGISTLCWMDADYRCMEMPQYMEAMKLADITSGGQRLLNPRHMTKAIAVATVVAVAASWWSLLSIYYKFGAASAIVEQWRTNTGQAPFNGLEAWITSPKAVDTGSLIWISVGLVFTILISVMRATFAWWPLNPIGYAVSLIGSYIDWIWFSIFLGWLFKRLTIRYGGLKSYRQTLPFFIGLVIGDYAIGAILALIQCALQAYGINVHGYRTFPI